MWIWGCIQSVSGIYWRILSRGMTRSDLNFKKNNPAFWVENSLGLGAIGRSREMILLDQNSQFRGLESLERTS